MNNSITPTAQGDRLDADGAGSDACQRVHVSGLEICGSGHHGTGAARRRLALPVPGQPQGRIALRRRLDHRVTGQGKHSLLPRQYFLPAGAQRGPRFAGQGAMAA